MKKPKPTKPKGERVWVEIDTRTGTRTQGWVHDTRADAEFWARLSNYTTVRRATLILDPDRRTK